MKYLIIATISLLANLSLVQASELRCQEIKCIDIEKPSNESSLCSNKKNEDIPQTTLSALNLSKRIEGDGLTLINIAEDGGDQFATYTFDSIKLNNLKVGQTIIGEFTNGYSWADGDHVRFKVHISCVAN